MRAFHLIYDKLHIMIDVLADARCTPFPGHCSPWELKTIQVGYQELLKLCLRWGRLRGSIRNLKRENPILRFNKSSQRNTIIYPAEALDAVDFPFRVTGKLNPKETRSTQTFRKKTVHLLSPIRTPYLLWVTILHMSHAMPLNLISTNM